MVQCQKLLRTVQYEIRSFVQRDFHHRPAPLLSARHPGMIHPDLPHQWSREGEELFPAIETRVILMYPPQIRFMN